jgi:hypothetical protein
LTDAVRLDQSQDEEDEVTPNEHCCDRMREEVEQTCDMHPDRFDCPEILVDYDAKLAEYGLMARDETRSVVTIDYCPWCGAKLPESKRDEWFDRLEAMGLDPWTDELPPEYETDEWWRVG